MCFFFFKQLIVLSLSTSYYCTFTYQDLCTQKKKAAFYWWRHPLPQIHATGSPVLLQLSGGRGKPALCFSHTGISTAMQKDISSFCPHGKLLREQDMLQPSNIPQDDFQGYHWGLIHQLLHSLYLANTFFPVEILPNRLKRNFLFFYISLTTHSKNRSATEKLAKADPSPPAVASSSSSPAAYPHYLPCGRGDCGWDPRAPLQKVQPEGQRE